MHDRRAAGAVQTLGGNVRDRREDNVEVVGAIGGERISAAMLTNFTTAFTQPTA
jgi:hypothetical protein